MTTRLHVLFLLGSILAATMPVAAVADFESAAEDYRQRNFSVAFEEFMELARDGDARAQTVVALMYKFGESVEKDPSKALDWYMKAAEGGYPPAQFHLGMMYIDGDGTQANREAGLEWLRKSAENGFERARVKLSALDSFTAQTLEPGPASWSRSWDLRLPNDMRFEGDARRKDIYRVQLAAMGSREAANRFWEWLQLDSGQLFNGLRPNIILSRVGNETRYRIQTGPFASLDEARSFCDELNQHKRNADCTPLAAN